MSTPTLLKNVRVCSICGRGGEEVQLLTITPQIFRKPREIVVPRAEQGRRCTKMARGVVVCDDCFALGMVTDGAQLWERLCERLKAAYKSLREVSE